MEKTKRHALLNLNIPIVWFKLWELESSLSQDGAGHPLEETLQIQIQNLMVIEVDTLKLPSSPKSL